MGISTQQDLENAWLSNSVFPEPKTKSALPNMIFFFYDFTYINLFQ